MGIELRHVVWTSATLALGAFVYVVTLEPMPPKTFAGAGAPDRTPSRATLVRSIRRALSTGRLDEARQHAEELLELDPHDPSALFHRAIVDQAAKDEREGASWARLDEEIRRRALRIGPDLPEDLLYYHAWGCIGVGRVEEGRDTFRDLADAYERRTLGVNGHSGLEHYNLACYRAMGGQIEQAMAHWAQAVRLGYASGGSDRGWWLVDPDLEPLRNIRAFWETASWIYEPVIDDGPAGAGDPPMPSAHPQTGPGPGHLPASATGTPLDQP